MKINPRVYCPVTGYTCNYAYKTGCRCVACTDFLRMRCYRLIERKAKQVAMPRGPKRCAFPKLKPYTGYQYGCRCPKCRSGNAAQTKKFRIKRILKEEGGNGT